MASPERVGKLRISPQPSPQSKGSSPESHDPHANLRLQIEKFQALLAVKQAKYAALDEDEGNCMARLAALDMACRRFTMEARPGISPTRRRSTVTARARAASGAYGFQDLAKSIKLPADSDDSDIDESDLGEKDQVLWSSVPEEGPDGEPSQLDALSPGPEIDGTAMVYGALGTGNSQSRSADDAVPLRRSQTKHPMRRRLSTTTSRTRPSEIPGNRAIRLERKTPGETLGFILKTVKIATVNPETGQPTGNFVDPTFVAEVEPEGLAYKSGLRPGDHILEIDGEACQTMKHDFVVRLLKNNQGTVSMVVRYTSDYRRTVLHRRLLARRSELAEIAERYSRLDLEERQLLERIEALKKLPPGIQFPVSGDEPDLLMADVLGPNSKWTKDMPKLVSNMLEQWKREREFWIDMINRQSTSKNPTYEGFGEDDDDSDDDDSDDGLEEAFQAHLYRRATLDSRRDTASSGGSSREAVLRRTSVIGNKVMLDLHEDGGNGTPTTATENPREEMNSPDTLDPNDPAHTWV